MDKRGVLLFAFSTVFLAAFVYTLRAGRVQEIVRVSVTLAALILVVISLFWAYANNVQTTLTTPK